MSELVRKAWEWLKERAALDELPFKRVPYDHFSLGPWLGAVVAGSFALLAITGLILLFYYDPEAPAETNKELLEEKPFFNLLLTTHLYAAHAMLLAAGVHMVRNFFLKIYEKPRELLWIIGVITGFMALQTAFFGYSLIGDTTAFEAVQIGKGLVANSLGEWLGKTLGALAFGTEGIDFGRVLALHIIFAGILGLLFALHFSLFEGIGPFLGRRKREVREEELAPWFPVNFVYMLALLAAVWGIIVLANALSQAAGFIHRLLYPLPIFEGTELAEKVRPMPPWFLVYAFKLFQLDFLYLGVQGFNALPILILSLLVPPLILISLPFIDKAPTADPLKRYKATSITLYLVTMLIVLTVWGAATLGYASKFMVAAIFIAPAIVIFAGLKVMEKYKDGEITAGTANFYMAALILFGVILSLVAGITANAPGAQVWGEVGSALVGVFFGALFVYLAAYYSDKIRREEAGEEEHHHTSQGSGEIPNTLVYIAIGGIVVIAITASMLFYSAISALEILAPTTFTPPPDLDPLKNPAGIAALTAALLLGLYTVLFATFRALTIDKVPYKGAVKECLPHLPTLIAFIVALVLVF